MMTIHVITNSKTVKIIPSGREGLKLLKNQLRELSYNAQNWGIHGHGYKFEFLSFLNKIVLILLQCFLHSTTHR